MTSKDAGDEVASSIDWITRQIERLGIGCRGAGVVGLPVADFGEREILARTQAGIEVGDAHPFADQCAAAIEQAEVRIDFP